MPGSTVILFQTHFVSRPIMRQFRRLRRQSPLDHHAVMLVHVPAGTPKPEALKAVPHHFVTTPELRGLGYPEKRWRGSTASDVVAAGATDLLLLHFWAARRGGFDRFWVVEYDVRFSGDWRTFFGAFAANDADLLATAVRRRDRDPAWTLWATLREPQRGFAPGGGRRGAAEGGIACFMPVFRATDRAVARVDAAYAEGWGGHCEAVWPTVLARHGMRIEDVGGDGEFVAPANRNRFYTNGTFTFRPVRMAAGLRPDTLWHPVKPIATAAAYTLVRIWRKLRSVAQLGQ